MHIISACDFSTCDGPSGRSGQSAAQQEQAGWFRNFAAGWSKTAEPPLIDLAESRAVQALIVTLLITAPSAATMPKKFWPFASTVNI